MRGCVSCQITQNNVFYNLKLCFCTALILVSFGTIHQVQASTTNKDISRDEIERLILDYSIEYSEKYNSSFSDVYNLSLNIAWAESHFENIPNYIYDGEDGNRTAWGIFQLTRTFYKNFCGDPEERKDIKKNISCGVRVIAMGGYEHWMESYNSWVYLPYFVYKKSFLLAST